MTTHKGYLLIADISGYTQFLTSSELEHANPILQSLLSTMVEQLVDPLHFWKMEGDAVLAYSTQEGFPSGETFLATCENLYNAFTTCRQNIVANTTCPCQACANVNALDLKIIAHHGEFDMMQVGPMKDISGADVILVHRMTKTDVSAVTGIRSYALFSDAAVNAMGITAALQPYSEPIEYFGEVSMQVYDLAKAWKKFRAGCEHFFLEEKDGIWTYRRQFDLSAPVVWDALTAPDLKQRWMDGMIAVTVDRPTGRIGAGSGYHCAHKAADFLYWVTDWEPFSYFSTRINDPGREGISMPETYQLIPTKTGTELRYTIGQAYDADGNRSKISEQEAVGFLSEFWPVCFDEMDAMLRQPDKTAA